MAKIHYMKDKDGNTIYPVTHADAILGLENISGNDDTFDEEVVDANDITELKGKRLTGEGTLNLPADATTWGILETVLDNENDGYQTFIPEYGDWAGTVAIRSISDHGSTLGAWYWQLDTASWGDYLLTNDKTIIGAINELFQSANSGKELIASAIGEPLNAEDTFSAMSTDINGLLSTFKTNMMNNGITVESGDKFKSLIDKIATMVEEGSGKGIQFASGEGSWTLDKGQSVVIPTNSNFIPTYVFYIADNVSCFRGSGYEIYNNILLSNLGIDTYFNYTGTNAYAKLNEFISIKNINSNNFTISTYDNGRNGAYATFATCKVSKWFAIGVGEEDTTLRDSLASVLENKGVEIIEEDDMASLISKVSSISGGLDIISATELPATGRENQICVITDNPVNSFSISSDSNNFASGSIGILLEANNPVLGGNLTLSSNNIITNYPIYKIYQNNTPMNSFYWSNGMWNKLTIDYLYLVNNGKLENTNYFGSIASGGTWKVNDSGLVTSGNNTYVNQFTSFSNLINFNHFKKIDITFTSSKTNSSNYKPSIYVGSFKTVVNDSSSTSSSYPVAHMNQYKLASNLTCSAGVAKTVTLDISAITGEYYFGFAFKSYTDWTITVSNIRLY